MKSLCKICNKAVRLEQTFCTVKNQEITEKIEFCYDFKRDSYKSLKELKE